MPDELQMVLDLSALEPGQDVEVHTPGRAVYHGIIEETMPQMNLVWVREATTGERKMLLMGESYLYQKTAG